MTGNPSQTPTCSLVIRAYNEEKHLERLFHGIAQQSLQEVEVILVDSGSTDHTCDIAEQNGARLAHISPEDFSFGRSLNLGITQARSEYIIIASAHVYPVYPDWLEHIIKPFMDTQCALSYGKQRGAPDSYFSEQQIFHRWYPDYSQTRQAHPFNNNANASIRKSLWEIHPYDESLSGLEDIAWANWAIEQGYTLSYVAEAEVVHVHNETPKGVYNRYRREAMAFKTIYPQESFRFHDLLRLSLINITSDLYRATRKRVLTKNIWSIFWFRWMQFWGTYQGYKHSGPLTQQLRQTFYYPDWTKLSEPPAVRTVQPIEYSQSKKN